METEAAELSAAQRNLKKDEVKTEAKEEPKPEKKEDNGFLGGMMDTINEASFDQQLNEDGNFNTDTMGGTQRVVAGGIDLAMDALSMVVPALKPADEWWEEKSGRNAGKDPYKKAERDIGGMMIGTILGGNIAGAAANKIPGVTSLSARTKFFGQAAADLGIDSLLSYASDTTREPGNFGTLVQNLLPNGMQVPWATRDGDSPDVVFSNNMLENLVLGGMGEFVSAAFAWKGLNKITPQNDIAKFRKLKRILLKPMP